MNEYENTAEIWHARHRTGRVHLLSHDGTRLMCRSQVTGEITETPERVPTCKVCIRRDEAARREGSR